MGSSSQQAPYVPPAAPDPDAVAAEQRAANIDQQATQSDLASQSATLARQYGGGMLRPAGAIAAGAQNGAPSLALAPSPGAAL